MPAFTMTTLGIYVQVPFCASKCSFCNFSSRVARPETLNAYPSAVNREIALLRTHFLSQNLSPSILDLPVDTVYFGGGTPSLLGSHLLGKMVEALRHHFRFSDCTEFTLEVTPGSADAGFLRELRAMGTNRLSIGAQTFDDRELRSVGRLHSAQDTCTLVEHARRAGFHNISLDLIAGLPYQTAASWKANLSSAIQLRPEHLSVYLFEIDDKSRLGSEVLDEGNRYHATEVPDEAFMADAYETAREYLRRAGYIQYEISNFALPGFESRHNQKYWRLEPYLGLGAGAHSFDGVHRWANTADVEEYEAMLGREASPNTEFRSLSPSEQLEEFFFLGLRQCEGVDLDAVRTQWGRTATARWEPTIAELVRTGWLQERAGRWALAERAHLVSNEIFQQFLAD